MTPHVCWSQAGGLLASSRWLSVPGTVFAEGELWCGAKRYHRYSTGFRMHPEGMPASVSEHGWHGRTRAAIPSGWLIGWPCFRWCRFAQHHRSPSAIAVLGKLNHRLMARQASGLDDGGMLAIRCLEREDGRCNVSGYVISH